MMNKELAEPSTINDDNNSNDCNSSVEKEENIAIVRSIASYLSLSEVESLGSLYSLMSPQSHHHHSHSHSYRTPRLSLGNVIREEDDRDYDTNRNINRNRNGHANRSINANESDTNTIHSGPDAAAGFGFLDTDGIRSRSSSSGGNSSSRSMSRTRTRWKAINSINDDEDDDCGLETPGLIALTPIPLNELEGYYYDDTNSDENEEEEERDDNHYNNSNYISTNHHHHDNKYKTLKHIQQKLQKDILSHPRSIRSYCLSSHQKAKVDIENSLVGVLCPDCGDNAMHLEVVDFWHNENDRRKDEEHDEQNGNIGRDKNGRQQQQQQQQQRSVYTCICQRTTSQSIPSNMKLSHHNHHKPMHYHIFQILASPLFQNIPLSIIIDLTIQSTQTTTLTMSASLSLMTSSIQSIVKLLAQTIHKVWEVLSSLFFNPFALLDFLVSIQQKAMGSMGFCGISSEAIVTGIQSVTTLGSGSDQKHPSNVCGAMPLTRDGVGGIGGGIGSVGGLVGSVMSGSAVGGRSSMGLTDWWRGGAAGSGRENLISEKVSVWWIVLLFSF